MAKKKIYAVRKGHKTGLFYTWDEFKKASASSFVKNPLYSAPEYPCPEGGTAKASDPCRDRSDDRTLQQGDNREQNSGIPA